MANSGWELTYVEYIRLIVSRGEGPRTLLAFDAPLFCGFEICAGQITNSNLSKEKESLLRKETKIFWKLIFIKKNMNKILQ